MFMVVKYGDGKEQFFNTECRTKLLLECIKEKCDGINDGLIDLADENGEIMFLHERADHYGNEFLKPRGIYILIRKQKCDKNYPLYTPLLNDERVIDDRFLRQLSSMREEAIRRVENQRSTEPEKLPQGKGRNAVNKRTFTRDANYKRTQSLLSSNGKKQSKSGRPSRSGPST